ncbi:MAG: hypothetical protein ACRCXD_09235 [Luteolibacter sp.]
MTFTLGDSSFFSKQLTALTAASTTLVQSDQHLVSPDCQYFITRLQEILTQSQANNDSVNP